MKFGKNLTLVVEISDPEWAPFWINYKFLKKKINDIVASSNKSSNQSVDISKSICEVEFFRSLRYELKKASDFFASSEHLYKIRQQRVKDGYILLKQSTKQIDKQTWKMLLSACMKLYKDILLLENFAIMNYCGFSKILKKHDKQTGHNTREAFMSKVMSTQNFTHYTFVLECIKEAEELFANIQAMESTLILHDEEKLFIEAIRDLNYQASKLQAEEKEIDNTKQNSEILSKSSKLFPNNKTDSSANLDEATNFAIQAAAKVNHSICSPNIQVALSWMEAIRRKEANADVTIGTESITDDEDNDTTIGNKRERDEESEDNKSENSLYKKQNTI